MEGFKKFLMRGNVLDLAVAVVIGAAFTAVVNSVVKGLITPLIGVFGRNDGDHEGLRAFAQQGMGIEIFESPHSLELGGQRILLVHDLADTGQRSIDSHSVVVHGFTHREEMKERGETLIVNPGEGCGWLHGDPSGAIIDLNTKKVQFLKLKDTPTFKPISDA